MTAPAAAVVTPRVQSWTLGVFEENGYLVADPTTGAAALVDPGDEGDQLVVAVRDAVRAHDLRLEAVWLTHGHLDHVGALAEVKAAFDLPAYLHPLDLPVFDYAPRAAAMYGLPWSPQPAPDREFAEGQELALGNLRFTVMHAPGHAPGHVVIHGHGVAIGGDVLFRGSVGRVDLPLADPRAFSRTLERVAALPPETVVYPGHGPPTTIGRELASNPFLNGGARVRGG
ncbi:MBL fold hydrolase [Gemmatimonadetes bacterium T265]|nr:MBL fold hydrolase [Gemmatimonadetes bacterium T265]